MLSYDSLSFDSLVTASAAAAVAAAIATAAAAAVTTAAARAAAVSAAATASAAAAAESTAAAGAASTGLTRFGLTNGDCATVELVAVETGDCRLAFSVIVHGNEREAAAAAGVAIGDDLGAIDSAVRSEESREAFLGGRPGEISDVEFQTDLE
jgi:hypothetical protein